MARALLSAFGSERSRLEPEPAMVGAMAVVRFLQQFDSFYRWITKPPGK